MSEGFKPQLENAIKHAGSETPTAEASRNIDKVRGIAGPDAWKKIENTQENKRSLIREFSEWRKKFWDARGAHADERKAAMPRIAQFEKEARTLTVRRDGTFEAFLKGADPVPLTRGEAYAASEWGTWWKFDNDVPREHQLGLMRSQVRAKLAERYDDQLITFGKNDRLTDEPKREAYARMEKSHKSFDAMPDGILVEKMLVSFLTKEMHDGEFEFTVERGDANDDVEYKIDFKITVKDRRRGVHVNQPEQRIGIQFTMNQEATEQKQEQVARAGKRLRETDVDELILVTMPINEVREPFNKWRYRYDGTPRVEKELDPRGPDMFWSQETKKAIMDALIRNIHHA